jgi:hypothetical protein
MLFESYFQLEEYFVVGVDTSLIIKDGRRFFNFLMTPHTVKAWSRCLVMPFFQFLSRLYPDWLCCCEKTTLRSWVVGEYINKIHF